MELNKYEDGDEIGIAIGLVSIISICLVLGGLYCCLKNRGMICKKERKAPNTDIQVPHDVSDRDGS